MNLKQDKQRTYNVILTHVRVTIVAIENIKYYIILVRVCILCYPPCIAHEPYYTVTCGLSASTIVLTLSRKEYDFRVGEGGGGLRTI